MPLRMKTTSDATEKPATIPPTNTSDKSPPAAKCSMTIPDHDVRSRPSPEMTLADDVRPIIPLAQSSPNLLAGSMQLSARGPRWLVGA